MAGMHLPADAGGHRPGESCEPQRAAGEAVPGERAPIWGGFDAGEGPARATRGFGAGTGTPGEGSPGISLGDTQKAAAKGQSQTLCAGLCNNTFWGSG